MFNPLSLDAPYSPTQFQDNLVVYDTCQGLIEYAELSRLIQESGNYYWQGVPFPVDNLSVGAGITINGSVQVPKGSYVTGMTVYSDQDAGFKLKVYDKGTKASIFYGDYQLARVVGSMMQADAAVGAALNTPFGPNLLMSPFIITGPGVLGWEIVNLATVSATIQVMLSVAVPINETSVGQKIIDKKGSS